MNKRISPLRLAVYALALASLACSIGTPAPTATPLPPPAPTDTATPIPPTDTPTITPSPTATPDIAATQRAEEFQSMLQSFADDGYIETTEGESVTFDDFKQDWAQLGWYKWWPQKGEYANFVFKAHVKWSTASSTPEISGCGIIFGLQDNDDHYAVILDKSRILFLMKRGQYSYSVGKTRGPGRTNFGNPAEAEFAVIVKGQTAYVSVDGEVTTYTLSADQTSAGEFAFTVLSGTNKDYGTRCEMKEIILWSPK